jgi:hypothetical protein
MDSGKGGCSCGAVRFELAGHPLWVLACHCDACKKRTGSAYGVSVMVENKSVKEFTGETRTYTRAGDSGIRLDTSFARTVARPFDGTLILFRIVRLSLAALLTT